jgi:hypothetical protein
MSPTSIAKVRLRLEAASVRVGAIEVETAAEIGVDAAVGRAAAAAGVDAGDVAVEVAVADGTAVVMADRAADDTRPRSGPAFIGARLN